MSDFKWLQSVQAGDYVIYKPERSWGNYSSMVRVQKVTATQIVATVHGKEMRFRRDTGIKKGDSFDRLLQPTPYAVEKIRCRKLEDKITSSISGGVLKRLTGDQMEHVLDIFEKAAGGEV